MTNRHDPGSGSEPRGTRINAHIKVAFLVGKSVLSLIEAPGAETRAQEEAILDLENQLQLYQT